MPLSRPRRNRHKKRSLHPAWLALLKARIDAAVVSGDPLQQRRAKGNTSKLYAEGSFTEAIRAGDVAIEVLLSSPEVCASPGTVRKWRKVAASLDNRLTKA